MRERRKKDDNFFFFCVFWTADLVSFRANFKFGISSPLTGSVATAGLILIVLIEIDVARRVVVSEIAHDDVLDLVCVWIFFLVIFFFTALQLFFPVFFLGFAAQNVNVNLAVKSSEILVYSNIFTTGGDLTRRM